MMAENSILQADDQTFETVVIHSDLPVLVDFWAPWCGPCHLIARAVEELAGEYEGRVRFVKVNVDEARKTAESLDIMAIPTIIVFQHGEATNREVGVQPRAVLDDMIAELLGGSD